MILIKVNINFSILILFYDNKGAFSGNHAKLETHLAQDMSPT